MKKVLKNLTRNSQNNTIKYKLYTKKVFKIKIKINKEKENKELTLI